jgi:hypothetical protein
MLVDFHLHKPSVKNEIRIPKGSIQLNSNAICHLLSSQSHPVLSSQLKKKKTYQIFVNMFRT